MRKAPRFAREPIEGLHEAAVNAARLLFTTTPADKLYRKYVGQTHEQHVPDASVLWNTSFVVDYSYRSRLLRTCFGRDLAASRAALFGHKLAQPVADGTDLQDLAATPRSFPHLLSLRLFQASTPTQMLLVQRIAEYYSPRSVGFYEAEYVTLQLLSMLVHHLPRFRPASAAVAASYLAGALAAVTTVLEQNENLFCNEQFNDKYNVLLLTGVDHLQRHFDDPELEPLLRDAGLNRVNLARIQRAILPKILGREEKRDYLTAVTEETEYLLYLLRYAAGYAVAGKDDVIWRIVANLAIELTERYEPNGGFITSRTFRKAFNFQLPLVVLAYERLLETVR